ncbi:zinc finger and BTB domain-containing protein 24-like isoform X2 [Thrips palmi]|nr:zinc finger and BTB domain-containing protein 24-like isoform X2 [Thrips palmi]
MDHQGVLDLRYAKKLQFSEVPKTFLESAPLDLSISKNNYNNNGLGCEELNPHTTRPSVITSTSNLQINRDAIIQRSRWNHRSHPSIDSDSSFESEYENDISHSGVWFTKRLGNTTDASRCSSTDSLRWRERMNSSEITDHSHTDTENDSEAYDSGSTLSLGFYKELPELTANVSIDQNSNNNSMIIELSSCKAEIIDPEEILKVQFKRKNEENENQDNHQISQTESYFEELLTMQTEERNDEVKLTKNISAGIRETASKYIKEIRKTKADMFTSGLNLEVDGKKKQHCLKCNEEFSSVTGLLQHLMTHSSRNPGEKLIKCPVCTKRFSTLNTLEQHILRLHTGEMKYVCKICETPYKFSTHLKKHMSTSRCGKATKKNN